MPEYRYLIVGAGMTADAAVEGIRQADPAGSIGVIGAEPDPPYNRPPLSKGLWKGDPVESIWRSSAKTKGAELHLGRRAVKLDPADPTVVDDTGASHKYQKLLLATGGVPRQLPGAEGDVIYYRTLADYQHLRKHAERKERVIVVGGGFIGSEVAAGLRISGAEVTMVFPEEGLGARIFPADLSQFLVGYYREKGVTVRTGAGVEQVTGRGRQTIVRTSTGEALEAEVVVAGLGITPSVELAQQAGLSVDNGIVVDRYCRTSHAGIYAAGDVASFPNPALGVRLRVEHEDNANTMGRTAGLNMAGQPTPYDHLPFFYSDLFELGYEAVGELDPRLETVADWVEPFRQGVVYYLRAGRVRGVLLWNTWGQVDTARGLIAEPGPWSRDTLQGRIR